MAQENDLPNIFKNASLTSSQQINTLEQQAMDIITDMSKQYVDWTQADITKLKNALKMAQTLTGKDLDAFIRSDLYPTLHDIKGQGTTFGYPLMTALGTHACAIVKENQNLTATHLAQIAQDISDMHLVLEHQLTGSGGTIGEKITERLQKD